MAMEEPPSLQHLMTSFTSKISQLQQLLVIRNSAPGSSAADLASVDIVVRAMEHQLETIKAHLKAEAEALPKAKALIELSSKQERKLKHIVATFPTQLSGLDQDASNRVSADSTELEPESGGNTVKCAENIPQKDKKGRNPPPRWYLTTDELESLSSYMRGRLTIDKINAAVDEMATYAEANARLLGTPRRKLGDDLLERVLELRDIAASEGIKGKHFFLESDMRGPILKLDNTGKAILTVLRHLGRISDVRAGRQRAFVLLKL